MIKRFKAQNYKALRDVTVDLTPIHVLIGPNDSGKTSILEAIAALSRSVDHPLVKSFMGAWRGQDLVWQRMPGSCVGLSALCANGSEIDYFLSVRFENESRGVTLVREKASIPAASAAFKLGDEGNSSTLVYQVTQRKMTASVNTVDASVAIHNALFGVQIYRWNPRMLSLPVAPDSQRRFQMDPSGFGLALCLDDILGFDRDLFAKLENRFRSIFPHVESIKLVAEQAYRSPVNESQPVPMLQTAEGKGIYFKFDRHQELVPASQVSDGMLLVLAYLAVLNLPHPPRLLLVEEPENGIHPKRLQDLLTILRDVVTSQQHTQVILTTHSPYVIDLFDPAEVSLCQMNDDGAVSVHKLSDSKKVRDQLKVFTLGEIWTAEGDAALAQDSN